MNRISMMYLDSIYYVYNFRNHLNYLADKPHFTGQKRDRDIAMWIAKCFKHLWLEVSAPSYNVLLSFPKFRKNDNKWDTRFNGNNVNNSKTFSLFILFMFLIRLYTGIIMDTNSFPKIVRLSVGGQHFEEFVKNIPAI